jgi:hypothetical protein
VALPLFSAFERVFPGSAPLKAGIDANLRYWQSQQELLSQAPNAQQEPTPSAQ